MSNGIGYFEPPDKYKTLLRRIGAGIADALLFLVVSVLALRRYWDSDGLVGDILAETIGLAFIGYSVLMHWRFGATLGKMAFRIRVVDHRSESKITLKQALIRDAVPLAAGLLGLAALAFYREGGSPLSWLSQGIGNYWFYAEILSALFNDKRRAIHDFMAGTVCIKIADGFRLEPETGAHDRAFSDATGPLQGRPGDTAGYTGK